MSKKVTVQLKQKRTPVLTDRVRVFLPTSQKQQRISLQSVISPLAMAIFSPPHKRQTWTTTGVQLSFGRKHETESPDPPCFTNKRVFSFVFLPTLFLSVLCGPVSCFVLPLPSPPHPTPAPLLPAFHADAMSPPPYLFLVLLFCVVVSCSKFVVSRNQGGQKVLFCSCLLYSFSRSSWCPLP